MRYMLVIICFLLSFSANADVVRSLRSDYPKRYIVQPGDTLWSIANRYLHRPWEWKTLWHANPQIKNPNRLYPGAELVLSFYRNTPYIRVLSNGVVKLSPFMRERPGDDAIPAIPLNDIKPFLNASLVMDKDVLVRAPYIVALIGEHMLGGQGDELYVKHLHPKPEPQDGSTISYAVFRPGPPYTNPVTQNVLGYKATLVGYGELVRGGEPATMLLTEITEGVRLTDRVILNNHPEFDLYFEPKAPEKPVRGNIIDLLGDYTQGAVGLIAVIDLGKNAGLEAGDVLGIFTRRKLVNDPLHPRQQVLLPPERLGEVMVFRTFTKTSFALVVRSIRAIRILDKVTNP